MRARTGEVRGATAVAGTFSGRARFAQPVLIDGAVGAVWVPGGRPRVVFGFTVTGRSPKSTWSLTLSGFASSTWRSSITDEGRDDHHAGPAAEQLSVVIAHDRELGRFSRAHRGSFFRNCDHECD
jgi:hypothetical protein